MLAILGGNAEILYATPAALRLFGAGSRADLERALGAGDSPTARRLRHLAATLPVGGPPRLERIRFSLGRRTTSLNLLCARVPAPGGGTALTLSTSELAGRRLFPAPMRSLPPLNRPPPAPFMRRRLRSRVSCGRSIPTGASAQPILCWSRRSATPLLGRAKRSSSSGSAPRSNTQTNSRP